MCSGNGTGNECVSCLEGYIVYDDLCVVCMNGTDCPFNNSKEANCTENDHSHCGIRWKSCKKNTCEHYDPFLFASFCVVPVLVIVVIAALVAFFVMKRNRYGYFALDQDPFFFDTLNNLFLIEYLVPEIKTENTTLFIMDCVW